MQTSKAKQRFISTIENEGYLRYEDDVGVSDGDSVIFYGRRWDEGDRTTWRVLEVMRDSDEIGLGDGVEVDPARRQLILRAQVSVDEAVNGSDYTVTNVEVVDADGIHKPKDEIKHKIVQIARVGLPHRAIISDTLTDTRSDYFIDAEMRPLREDDFKVTTKRTGLMHLGRSDSKGVLWKLGANWSSWHNKTPTEQLHTLSHELVHCFVSHHREGFFTAHAELIANITNHNAHRKRMEALFGEIDWKRLKTLTLDGPNRQSDDIDTTGHPHRRSACMAVVDKMEDILDYRLEVGRTFYTNPPTMQMRSRWVHEYDHSENEGERPENSELRPDDVEMRPLDELEFDTNFDDEGLFNYLHNELAEGDTFTKFTYGYDDLPVVEDGTVVKQPKLAALFDRMVNEGEFRDGFDPDTRIPVRVATNEMKH